MQFVSTKFSSVLSDSKCQAQSYCPPLTHLIFSISWPTYQCYWTQNKADKWIQNLGQMWFFLEKTENRKTWKNIFLTLWCSNNKRPLFKCEMPFHVRWYQAFLLCFLFDELFPRKYVISASSAGIHKKKKK